MIGRPVKGIPEWAARMKLLQATIKAISYGGHLGVTCLKGD